jgi:hypothetical protein
MTGKIRALMFLASTAVATSLSGCVVDATPPPPPACTGPGSVFVDWTIDDGFGHPLSCASAGATTVELTVGGVAYDFPCGDYQGVTPSIVPGSYSIDVALLDGGRNVLSEFPAAPSPAVHETVFDCTETDLPTVAFSIN